MFEQLKETQFSLKKKTSQKILWHFFFMQNNLET